MELFFEVALRDGILNKFVQKIYKIVCDFYKSDFNASTIQKVAFQAQLEYMGVDGRKMLKVIFEEFDSTENEQIIKQSIWLGFIWSVILDKWSVKKCLFYQ